MAVGKPLHLRLFLEGEEVPVIAAQVSININAPSTAAIQIVPLDEAMDLKPRTMVHLFFLDERASSGNTTVKTRSGDVTIRGNYRLLFPGEAIGFSYIKNVNSRGFVLQCVDHSNYWDSAHATALEYGPHGNAFTETGSVSAGDTSLFDDIVSQQAEQLVTWIKQQPVTPGLTSVGGLAGGVIRIMEAMGGVPGHHRGVNDFFTVAELRCKLLQQVTAEEKDSTAQRLFDGAVFDQWVRSGLQNIGQQVTFRDMMLLLFKYIYYDFVPNPAAKFDAVKIGSTNTSTGPSRKLGEVPRALTAKKELESAVAQLMDLSDVSNLKKRADNTMGHCKSADKNLQILASNDKALSSEVAKIRKHITKAISLLEPMARSGGKLMDADSPRKALVEAIEALTSSKAKTAVKVSSTTSTSQRLKTQIIRPDCWFVAPPRCNVIFPEMYSQLSYDRNWVSECTRALLQVYHTLIGRDALMSDRILAPPISMAATSVIKYTGSNTYRVLMDHELHTGIVPRSEWISNLSAVNPRSTGQDERDAAKRSRLTWAKKASLFHFFKFRYASRQASVSGRFNPFMVCGFPAVVIQSPLILPKAAMDALGNSADQDFVNNMEKILEKSGVDVPNQLIGMVSGISHNIDQSGGTTSFSMHHARRHVGIDDEFLDLFFKSKRTVGRIIRVTITANEAKVNPEILKLLVGITPQGAAPKKGKTVVKKLTETQVSSTSTKVNTETQEEESVSKSISIQTIFEKQTEAPVESEFTVVGSIPEADKELILIPSPPGKISVGSTNGKFGGTVVGVEVLNNGQTIMFEGKRLYSAVSIYERVDLTRKGVIPFEEVIRPAWFSNSFANHNITKEIYEPFFGCSSVVDDLIVQGIAPPEVEFYGEGASPEDIPADMGKAELIDKLSKEEDERGLASVERAVTVLSYLYGRVKTQGLDVDEFIRSYVDRPIATIGEILGTDLSFKVNSDGKITSSTGEIGFHSTSVHSDLVNVGKFAGLIEDPTLKLSRINKQGSSEAIPPPYDVRKAKKDMVIEYIKALEKGPAIRG